MQEGELDVYNAPHQPTFKPLCKEISNSLQYIFKIATLKLHQGPHSGHNDKEKGTLHLFFVFSPWVV